MILLNLIFLFLFVAVLVTCVAVKIYTSRALHDMDGFDGVSSRKKDGEHTIVARL